MATPKPKPLPIPSAATPENPNAGAIPLSQYLDPSQVAPPYLSLPAAEGPEHAPIPPALLPPERPQAPQDPNAGAIPLEVPQPNTGAIDLSGVPGIYTPEQIKNTDIASLVADKNFRPVDWLADNEKNSLADPKLMEKVQDVYTAKLKADKGVLHDVGEAITSPLKTAKGAVAAGKAIGGSALDILGAPARALGRASTGDFQGAAGELAAVPQAVSLSERRDVNLLLKTLRGVKEKAGFGPETPEDYKKRLFFDLEMKKQENQAREGNGDLAKALGVDSQDLKNNGITVNPEAVEKMSVVADPINFIPVGGAVGAVGRFGKMVVATATTAERAEQLANILNNAARIGATKSIATLGTIAEQADKLAAAGAAVRHAPLGGSLGTLVKGAGLAAQYAAKPVAAAGKFVRETAPVTGVIAAEGLKGAAEAAAVTFPLTIGATPEEREALLNNIGLAAGLRAGGTAVGMGARVAGNWTRDKVAAEVYKSVERAPTQESPAYGTDPDLDRAHEQQMENTGSATKNVVNYFREFFRDSGIELYAMDKNDFVKNVDPVGGAAKAKGYYIKRGNRINPDGTQTPVNQIFLNGSADAIGHELFHAFEDIDPHGAAQLKTEIAKEWTPEEAKEWKQTYESALNGGKQEKDWTHRLNDDDLRSEAAAEVFGRVLDATDLTGVAPTIQQRAARFLSGVLEQLGFPIGGIGKSGGPGVSELGIRATTKQADAARNFISNLTGRVKETGSAIGTPQEAVLPSEITGGAISRTLRPEEENLIFGEKPATPPPAPVPAPAPAPAPTVPITVTKAKPKTGQLELPGVTAPNIRVPAQKQLDFAAKRAEVTNEAEATAAAKRVGTPEVQKVVGDINAGIDAGQTAFEIEHKGVKSKSTPEEPLARTPRRTEQEEAYVAESLGALPEDVRTSHQKVSSFVRWDVLKDGTPQFIGYSLDKAIANIEHLMRWSEEKGVAVPYSAKDWPQLVQDLKDYYNNQANGYRGDGQKFVRPTEDIQVSLPPENPNYSPVQLTTDKVQFLNAAQGLNAPLTVREVKGKIPANIKAQLLNELQGGTPQPIQASDIQKRGFKTPVGGRKFEIAEVNPLRAAMEAAGVPVRELIEVTERLNADDIVSATPRPDLGEVKPGVTDIIRSGFLPGAEGKFLPQTASGKALAEKGFDFETTGYLGTRGIKVLHNGDVVGEIITSQSSPERAYVASATINKKFRGQGVGEAAYRELFNALQKDGVSLVEGQVVAPQPLAIRRKIFGDEATDVNSIFGPIKPDEALANLKAGDLGYEVTNRITPEHKFLPAKKKGGEDKGISGWILPDQSFKGVGGMFGGANHEDFLAAQSAELNKKFGTKFGDKADANERINAINKGFVRMREYNGNVSVEVGQKFWNSKNKDAILSRVLDNIDDVNQFRVSVLNEKGDAIDSHTENLFMADDPMDAANKVVDSIRGKRGAYSPARVEPEGKFAPSHSEEIQDLADTYAKGAGISYTPTHEYSAVKPELMKRIADYYESAKDDPTNPEVKASYDALSKETVAQYNAIKDAGYTIEPFDGKGEPYKSSAEAVADIRDNKHLYYLRTEGAFGSEGEVKSQNPMLADSGIEINGEKLPVNDVFRAVHDFFGHGKEGYQFGPRGEFNAWRAHSEMFSPEAQGALAAETLAQNSWVNFGKHLRNEEGNVRAKGEEGYLGPTERPFAEQKNVIVPQDLIDEAKAQASAPEGKFLPQQGTREFDKYVEERMRNERSPEALPLVGKKDENGHYRTQYGDEPLFETHDYDFNNTPLAKKTRGKNAADSEEKYTDALADKIVDEYHKAKENPEISAGETWYSTAREKLQALLGDDTKFFAELLGATSPNTGVDVNFKYALEAYNLFKQGKYDAMLEKYREGKAAYENRELGEFEKDTGKTGKQATYNAFMDWWVDKHELYPTSERTKPTGEKIKFGFHTRAVMRVLDGSWMQQVEGPKTPNFTGNLTGATFQATIDVWAARLLHRLSNDGLKKQWRIQPPQEEGVKDKDFFTGQKAYRKAAAKLGIQPDALQAILWFAEKDRWEKAGWTKVAGKKKSDYNEMLSVTTKSPSGQLQIPVMPKATKKAKKVDNQLELGNL